MTFGEHLEELRRSLIKAVVALTIGFLIGLLFADRLVDYVQEPLRDALKDYYGRLEADSYRQYLVKQREAGLPAPTDIEAAVSLFRREGLATEERFVDPRTALSAIAAVVPGMIDLSALPPYDPSQPVSRDQLVPLRFYHQLEHDPRIQVIGLAMQEPFTVYIKAALVLGAVVSSPFVFYFIWQFVAAGLYSHERSYVHIFLPFSIVLFLTGAALAFFVAINYVLAFLLWFYQLMGIDPDPRLNDWLGFVLVLPLGFGISFQLPLVMLFLERIGIFTVASYLSQWRMAVLVIAVLSMILTPADPQSMILMLVPLVLLYFGGILLCRLFPRPTASFEETVE